MPDTRRPAGLLAAAVPTSRALSSPAAGAGHGDAVTLDYVMRRGPAGRPEHAVSDPGGGTIVCFWA